jgi:NAD(P)-dependent dehydrogenase (short-subunit alcohol dehydrogenase family)
MQIKDSVAVVTGAGSGIGAAMARRFAAEGAAAVVVSDLDGTAAQLVADTINADGFGPAISVATDVTDEAAVKALVDTAIARFGRVDLFCSNAGAGTGIGVTDPDPTGLWKRNYELHVLAHVYAVRAVVPSMLERGSGYLLSTASAAGLLTSPGDGPYTASKHAAVGLAEWLAVTYGDRGIGVSVLCPFGVATPLLMQPLADGNPAAQAVAASGAIISPEQVADTVVAGIEAGTFLLLPHPEVGTFWAQKASDPDRWLAGVRRLIAGNNRKN